MSRNTIRYADIPQEDEIPIKPRARPKYTPLTQDLYNSLISLVVNHRSELQKIPAAMNMATAGEWAEKRGLRAKEKDLDGDGINEVVLYNKAGEPVIINGYRPRKNDFGLRSEYMGTHSSREQRIKEPYRAWAVKNTWNKEQIDENNPYDFTVEMSTKGHKFKDLGYRIPSQPKKKVSEFSIFCKIAAPFVNDWLTPGKNDDVDTAIIEKWGNTWTPAIIKKIISPISIYRMLYLSIVEKTYFYTQMKLKNETNDFIECRKNIKANPVKFRKWFFENFVNKEQSFITPRAIADNMFAGDFAEAWDRKSLTDGLIGMLGKKILDDDEMKKHIIGEMSRAFLYTLQYYKDNIAAKKMLNDMKELASIGTKLFFSQYFVENVENEDEYNRFIEKCDNNLNPCEKDIDTELSPPKAANNTSTIINDEQHPQSQ